MGNVDKIFTNIMEVLNTSMRSFWNKFGREPNRVIMSKDVADFILAHYGEWIISYTEDESNECNEIMGMDLQIIHDKKGFIEVGYFTYNPCIVNLNYEGSE